MAAMWFYSDKSQQFGPVGWEELRELARSGQLRPTDLVWQEGTPDWLRASLVDGLIDGSLPPAPRRDAAPPPDRRDEPRRDGSRRDDPRRDEPRRDEPRRRPDEYDRPRSRDSRDPERRPEGSSAGLKIGLIIGGSVLFLVILVVVLIVVFVNSNSSLPREYNLNLFNGARDSRMHYFRGGQTIEIRVDSFVTGGPGGDANVDLFVYEPGRGFPLAQDNFHGRNCSVRFVAPFSGNYRVEVVNHGPANVSSRVYFR